MIEAKPNTLLRSEIITALFHKGYMGANYNLDDISAYVNEYPNSLSISFWDIDCTIKPSDVGYSKIKYLIKNNGTS